MSASYPWLTKEQFTKGKLHAGIINAKDESIRTPWTKSISELAAQSPGPGLAIAMLGGMATNHSAASQPQPLVQWLLDTSLFDSVLYLVGPANHLFSRPTAPPFPSRQHSHGQGKGVAGEAAAKEEEEEKEEEEKEEEEEEYSGELTLEERARLLPSLSESMAIYERDLVELINSYPANSLQRFCFVGYSIGGKYGLRLWPRLLEALKARHPSCAPCRLSIASGFSLSPAGVQWLKGGLSMSLLKQNDRRYAQLAFLHGRHLSLVCETLRLHLFGPSDEAQADEDCLYTSSPALREANQADASTYTIFSRTDTFYQPCHVWFDGDRFAVPAQGFDLTALPDQASAKEIEDCLDGQVEQFRLACVASPGARLSWTKGPHIPLASGDFKIFTHALLNRILALHYNQPHVRLDTLSTYSSSSSSSLSSSSSSSSSASSTSTASTTSST